jgi:hypothetical protein
MEKPALDFFLSELSVSDRHGGGLTTQRILGADLDRITCFVHVAKFALEYPPVERLQARSMTLYTPLDSDAVRCRLGSRPTTWLSQRQTVRAWQGRRVARAIQARFADEKRPLRALVCPQGAESLYAMDALVRRRRVDYITWIMDDQQIRWRHGKWRYPSGIEALLSRHLREARWVFVISPVMAGFYSERFGIQSEVLLPPADGGQEPVWESPVSGPACRLGYFGNVSTWALEALQRMVPRLREAGATLDVFGPGSQEGVVFNHDSVRLCGSVAKEELRNRMREYDAVVLPVTFAEHERNLAQFNIATRMSECLASGTVTLVVAPEYAAMARFLQPTGAACLVTEPSLSSLPEICKSLKRSDFRRSLLEKAQKLVNMELSVGVMRTRWSSALAAMNKID